MPLKYCLSISSLDPADAADVRALVRANGGDEAAGVQQYIDGIMRDVEELQAKVAPRTFNQPAWHGSPHLFDRFSTEFMGTGEGAQAFGWGLYFAEKKGIAEHYRENLSKKAQLRLKNRENLSITEASVLRALAWDFYHSDMANVSEIDADWLSAMADVYEEDGQTAEAEFVRSLSPGDFEEGIGRLYKVDIPEDSELLAWDVPLSEQPKRIQNVMVAGGAKIPARPKPVSDPGISRIVRAALKIDPNPQNVALIVDNEYELYQQALSHAESIGLDRDEVVDDIGAGEYVVKQAQQYLDGLAAVQEYTGEAAYKDVAREQGNEKEASLFLRDMGIPGHRFLDQGSRADGDGTYNYVIYDDSRINVLDFEQRQGEGPRGSIEFPSGGLENGETIIRLFESANMSTLIHESGHFFLEAFRTLAEKADAPKGMKDDLAAINEWLGHESGRPATPPPASGMVRMYHGGADGDGGGPRWFTSSLENARGWALQRNEDASQIYYVDVPRSDAMFDADYADQTVDQGVTVQKEFDPSLYGKANRLIEKQVSSRPYGVDAQEKWARGFEAYTMEGKAPSLALADAFARFKQWLVQIYETVRGLNVQLTPEIREVMDRMLATDEEIAQAREEANMNPLFTDAGAAGMSEADFRAYQRLARRSTEQAEQTLLEKTMAKIRREREAWYKDERKAVAAEVAATVNTRPEYRLIEAMANGRWLGDETIAVEDMRLDREELVSRYGEGVIAELSRTKFGGKRAIYGGDMSVEAAADFFGFRNADEMVRILQNTIKRKEFIVQETDKIMLDRYGDPFEDGSITEEAMAAIHSEQQAQTVAAEARQLAVRAGRPATNITARIFKARAQAMIGRMQVRQVRAARFLQAERQAARNAERAFARIVRTAANQRVSTEDAAALAEAQRFKEQQLLNHYLYMEARDVEAYVKSGRERMRRYDRKSVRQKLDGGYIEQIDAILSDYDFRVVSQVALDRRESLSAFVERMKAEGREAELAIDERLINEANRKHYSRLNVDELRGLFDTIANLDHLGRFKNELREKGRKRQLAESVSKVARQIETNIGTGKVEQNRGLRAGIRGYTNLLWSVDTMSVEYDGGEEVGTFYDEIKSSIDRGAVEEQRMGVEAATKMGEVFSVYSAAEIAAMKAKKVVEGGNGFAWSKLDILAAALNTGNRDNLERLLNPEVHETRRLTREQLDALLATLDKRDWDFVQSMWDLIDSYWPMLAEVELRRTGVKPQKVEATPVETAFGRYRGGYYPIAYDSTLPGKAIVDEQSAFDKYNSAGHGARAAVKNGMTKQRQQTGGGRTLNLDLNVPMSHIRDTIRLITMSEAIDNTYRILNHGDVRDAFLNAGRRNDWEVLNLWLKDVAAGPIYNRDAINATARFIKTNFTMSRLAFNLKTIALQLTGIGQSAAVIGKRNMMQGIVDYSKRPAAVAAEVVAKSSFMAERQSTFQKDMHDFANDVRVMSPVASRYWKVLDAVGKTGFWPIQKMQFYGVDLPTWLGAYRDGLAKFNDETKAVAYADRMVARSQASGLMADRSSFERGTTGQNQRQSDFVRLWTTLGSYMLAKLNRARITSQRGVVAVRHGDFVAAMNAAVDLMILYLAEGVMMGLAYSLMGDDDDEKDGSFAAFVATEAAGSVVGGVPFVREIASGLRGFDTGGVAGSALKIPVDIALQVGQGENDKGFRRALMDAVGVGTGLPTTQGLRIWEGLTDDQTPLSETLFGRNPLTR